MILRIILIVACLQATILSAQTEEQKQFMFERINHDAKGNLVLPKTESFANKEDLFKKAKIFPVYKMAFDKSKKVRLIQNKGYYLVFYIGRLYMFIGNEEFRFFENNPIIETITKLNLEKGKFNIVYLTENFSLRGKHLTPLILNEKFNVITNKDKKLPILQYIENIYGSFEKYKEKSELDQIRESLTIENYNKYITCAPSIFKANCPKDTTLVMKSLINQIREATVGFSKAQEVQLIERIMKKINPYDFQERKLKEALIAGKVNDSIIAIALKQSRLENKKNNISQEKRDGIYEFTFYDVNIINELLEILTDKQFIDYKRFLDIYNPVIETLNPYYNNKYRYNYGEYILQKEGVIKAHDYNASREYVKKIIGECGCHSNN